MAEMTYIMSLHCMQPFQMLCTIQENKEGKSWRSVYWVLCYFTVIGIALINFAVISKRSVLAKEKQAFQSGWTDLSHNARNWGNSWDFTKLPWHTNSRNDFPARALAGHTHELDTGHIPGSKKALLSKSPYPYGDARLQRRSLTDLDLIWPLAALIFSNPYNGPEPGSHNVTLNPHSA